MLNKFFIFLKSGFLFLKNLFAPLDPVQGICDAGHTLLVGHKCRMCDLDDIMVNLDHLRIEEKKVPLQFGLLGISGHHIGEIYSLNEDIRKIGTSHDCDIVITPYQYEHGESLRPLYCKYDNGVALANRDSETFLVNGEKFEHTDLYDHDIVELYGNKFMSISRPSYLDVKDASKDFLENLNENKNLKAANHEF